MKLIIKVLITVLFLQLLLGFLYTKYIRIDSNEKREINKKNFILKEVKEESFVRLKSLPTPIEYTDYQAKSTIEVTKVVALPSKSNIEEKVKIVKKIITLPKDKKIEKKIKLVKKTDNKKVKIAKVIPSKKPKPIVKVYKKIDNKIKLSTKIERYAKKMLGKKYVWGATGPKSYDCSGFTQRVFRKVAGIKLPRVSYLQAKVGKKISFNNLKQGDMVFFDTEKKPKGRVNHVGIYLKNGNFIHASSGGKRVMITNFRKKRFYKNRFLWGRRVIKDSRQVAINIKSSKIN